MFRRLTQNRFIGRHRACIDLNWFTVGRIDEPSKPRGFLKSWIKYRTGTITGGEITHTDCPNNMLMDVESPRCAEGVKLILPYDTQSPGYHVLVRLPAVQLAMLSQKIAELELDLSVAISSAREIKSFPQFQQVISSIFDIIQNMRRQIEVTSPEVLRYTSPTELEKGKV